MTFDHYQLIGRVRSFIFPGLALLAFEISGRAGGVDKFSLAIPSDIAVAFAKALVRGEFLFATFQTLVSAFSGILIGGGLGVGLGLLLGHVVALNRLLSPSIELVRPIPVVAMVPIVILFAGLSYLTAAIIVAIAITWTMMIFSRAAVRTISPQIYELTRALQLGWARRIWQVTLPSIIPQLFVALRLSIGFAFTITITVEITTSSMGLGHGIMMAQHALQPALMLAYLVWIALVGWGLNAVLLFSQQHFFHRFNITIGQDAREQS